MADLVGYVHTSNGSNSNAGYVPSAAGSYWAVGFDDGEDQPSIGDDLSDDGVTTRVLHQIILLSGDWSTDDAAGIYILVGTDPSWSDNDVISNEEAGKGSEVPGNVNSLTDTWDHPNRDAGWIAGTQYAYNTWFAQDFVTNTNTLELRCSGGEDTWSDYNHFDGATTSATYWARIKADPDEPDGENPTGQWSSSYHYIHSDPASDYSGLPYHSEQHLEFDHLQFGLEWTRTAGNPGFAQGFPQGGPDGGTGYARRCRWRFYGTGTLTGGTGVTHGFAATAHNFDLEGCTAQDEVGYATTGGLFDNDDSSAASELHHCVAADSANHGFNDHDCYDCVGYGSAADDYSPGATINNACASEDATGHADYDNLTMTDEIADPTNYDFQVIAGSNLIGNALGAAVTDGDFAGNLFAGANDNIGAWANPVGGVVPYPKPYFSQPHLGR
jgi:hypothetical protein